MKTQLICLLLAGCATATTAAAGKGDINDPEPRKIADAYVKAITDANQAAGREYLLGGVTVEAKAFKVAEAKIMSQQEPRKEDGSLADVRGHVAALDKSGLALLGDSAALSGAQAKREVTLDEARKMREQTKALRKELMTKFPVFADVIRADRTLYWHPKNPARALLEQSPKDGSYHVDYVSFAIESKETPAAPVKKWPLRVVRYKSGAIDSGWKVLPASEWDPEE